MRLILLLALLPLSVLAETVTYTRPTTYVDGTPLPAASITGYEFRCAAGGLSCAPVTAPGNATSVNLVVSVPVAGGTVCVEGRTLVGSLASAYGGGSGSACKSFPPTLPNPPGNVTIAVVIGVKIAPAFTYTAAGKRNAQVAGFVDVGTPCLGGKVFGYRGQPYRRVAQKDVRWWNTKPTTRVAAACA